MRKLAQRLYDAYQQHQTDTWHWYESLLAYDNGLLPMAMLCAAGITNDVS